MFTVVVVPSGGKGNPNIFETSMNPSDALSRARIAAESNNGDVVTIKDVESGAVHDVEEFARQHQLGA